MHYALIQNLDFGGNVFRYVTALNEPGTTIEQAVAKHFGDEKRLDDVLKSYAKRDEFMSGKLVIGKPPEAKFDLPRDLSGLEAGFVIAKAAISIGLASTEVIGLADALAASATPEQKTLAHALRAQLAVMANDEANAARNIALAKEGLSTANVDGRKALGRILLDRSTSVAGEQDKQGTLAEARSLYEAAHGIDAQDLESCWGFGLTSILSRSEIRAATESLAGCTARAPRHSELNYALAIGYSETGELQKMRDHLVYAIRYSRDSQARAGLRETLRSVDDRLRAEGRLKE